MGYKEVEKKDFNGKKVKVLDETYEDGVPECVGCGQGKGWRSHLQTREQKIMYLKTAERYWYSNDWYGSEKRK